VDLSVVAPVYTGATHLHGTVFYFFVINFLKNRDMKDSALRNLADKTFQNIANPLKGNGVYAEIVKAIQEAYAMGKSGKQMLMQPIVEDMLQAGKLQPDII